MGCLPVLDREPFVRKRALLLGVVGVSYGLLVAANAASQATGPATQTTPGIVSGHVRGPGGVDVPGATVKLIETQTGERKETWSDEAGNYTLAGVGPGTYKLLISLVGFQTDVREPVPVTAGKTLKVNVALAMSVPEESAAAGTHQPGGLPGLAALPPEVRERLRNVAAMRAGGGGTEGEGGAGNVRFSENGVPGGQSQAEASEQAGADSGSADSSSSASNSFLLSGSVGRAPTPGDAEGQWRERAEEFRRSRESQGAPGFGGGGGFEGGAMFWGGGDRGRRQQVNRLRGNVSERYSNSVLDARSYPLNVAESARIPYYREQVGAAIGGPLVIPKIYHRPDKTSFFVNYSLRRGKSPFDRFATVPTPDERRGDFSKSVITSGPFAGTVPTIYDPQSNPLGPRQAFGGNMIPPFRVDPAALGLLNYIPQRNLPGSVQNFHLQQALPSDSDRVMGRVGHQISAKDNVNVFYFFNSSRSESVGNFPGLVRNISVRSQNLNLGETHTFTPHTVNTLSFNFNRQRNSTLNSFAFQQDIARWGFRTSRGTLATGVCPSSPLPTLPASTTPSPRWCATRLSACSTFSW